VADAALWFGFRSAVSIFFVVSLSANFISLSLVLK
jgi:hypothetical protein